MAMRRCLVVLDVDLLALGEEVDLEPVNYLAGGQNRSGVKSWCCRWSPATR